VVGRDAPLEHKVRPLHAAGDLVLEVVLSALFDPFDLHVDGETGYFRKRADRDPFDGEHETAGPWGACFRQSASPLPMLACSGPQPSLRASAGRRVPGPAAARYPSGSGRPGTTSRPSCPPPGRSS